jgi:hypothetical protein
MKNMNGFKPFNIMPPMTGLLIETFGITFTAATLEQRLALIESVGFLMREMTQSLGYALLIIVPSVLMPEVLSTSNFRLANVREGLTLLALLYGSVNKEVPPIVTEE